MVSSYRIHSRSHPAVFLAATGIAAIMIYPFIIPLLLSAIATYLFRPMIKKIESHRLSHLALGILIILIGIPIVLAVSYITANTGQIFSDITGLLENVTFIVAAFSETISGIGLGTYPALPVGVKDITVRVTSLAMGIASDLVSTIPILLLDIVIFLYATYYFMSHGNEIVSAVKDYASTLPDEDEKFILSIMKGLKKSFDILIFSYITMSLVISAFSFIGYYVFGVPHPFLLAILTGLFGFLPVFGTWMVYIPAAAYMYYTGNLFSAAGILFFGIIILTFFIPMFLQPYLGSRQSDMNPLALLLGFFSGPVIFGAKGMLLGPIIFVVVQTIIHEYILFRIEIEKNALNYEE